MGWFIGGCWSEARTFPLRREAETRTRLHSCCGGCVSYSAVERADRTSASGVKQHGALSGSVPIMVITSALTCSSLARNHPVPARSTRFRSPCLSSHRSLSDRGTRTDGFRPRTSSVSPLGRVCSGLWLDRRSIPVLAPSHAQRCHTSASTAPPRHRCSHAVYQFPLGSISSQYRSEFARYLALFAAFQARWTSPLRVPLSGRRSASSATVLLLPTDGSQPTRRRPHTRRSRPQIWRRARSSC